MQQEEAPIIHEEAPAPRAYPTAKWLVLAGLLLAVFFLRLDWLQRPDVIGDEVHTYNRAHKSVGETLKNEAYPLNTFLCKAWLAATDWTDARPMTRLRMIPMAFTLATIALVFVLVERCLGLFPAAAAGVLIAVSPEFARQSVVCRYYPLFALCGIAIPLAIDWARSKQHWWPWALVALLLIVGKANHTLFLPMAGLLLVAGFLALWVARRPALMPRWRNPMALTAAGVGFVAVTVAMRPSIIMEVLRLLHIRVSGNPDDYAHTAMWREYELTWSGYMRFVLEDLLPFQSNPWVLGVVAAVALIGAGVLLRKNALLALLLLSAAAYPLPFFYVSAAHDWLARYFVPQVPALAVFLGLGAGAICQALAWLWLALRDRTRGMLSPGEYAQVSGALSLAVVVLAVSAAAPPIARERLNDDAGMLGFSEVAAQHIEPGQTMVTCPWWPGFYTAHHLAYYLNESGIYPGRRNAAPVETEGLMPARLAPFLYTWKGGPLWIITPVPSEHRERVEGSWEEIDKTMATFRAELVAEKNGARLWRYEGAPFQRQRLYEISASNYMGKASLADGADVVETPDADHEKAFYLHVPLDSPIEPKDGRPLPTVWWAIYFKPEIRAGIAASGKQLLYVVSFDMKYKNFARGPTPSRSLLVIAREETEKGKTWEWRAIPASGSQEEWSHEILVLHGGDAIGHPPAEEVVLGIGNRGGVGEVWLDNIAVDVLIPHDAPEGP